MKKAFSVLIVLLICFFASFTFAKQKDVKKVTDLTPWKGFNASILRLYQGEDGEKFFAAVQKHAPKGYSVKMVKDFFLGKFSLKFKTMKVIDKDTIIIDDNLKGDYMHVGRLITKWKKHAVTWEIFKTNSKEMIQAGYKYFLLMPFHQHGKDSLRHAHFRYGNANFDYLVTDPSLKDWWPTIYQPDTTDEAKIINNMTRRARMQASMLPKLK